ncbi:sensory transduction histidine kinase [Beggiatoa sp. PS]|nr:sensory transduction histidine kinase [Beggiatoa sp. PS]
MKTPVILCVDDEQILLDSLKHQLSLEFGKVYQIETAESGEEALELIEELLEENTEIPLIISDELMSGIKGHELLAQIHDILPSTLKILLTGNIDASALGKAINSAKLYRYMSKPWEPTDLILTVKEALESYCQKKELAEFYARLEKKVAERTRELKEKNEFLSIAVHDLKNPLSAIQGFSEMLKMDFDDMPAEEVIEVADKIWVSSKQMFELISNLLEVNAIESGKINLAISEVDILVILQGLVTLYRERAKAKHITLLFEPQDTKYLAQANENTIRQVFDNLISNAIKYSPYGKSVSVSITQNDQFVCCKIEDEGPGLSEEDQQKLFAQFTRLTPKPTGGEHSTGLGLFIVKKLMDSMQGKVWCESVLEKGATFFVEIPMTQS